MIPLLEIFQSLEQEENGLLTINGYEYDLLKYSQAQESIYRLYITHKKHEFCVEYAVGAQHVACTSVIFEELTDELTEFEITTRSPFMTLFKGKDDSVCVKCKDVILKQRIEANTAFKKLNLLSSKTGFEPYTLAKNRESEFVLRTVYHLKFPERTQELKDLIDFYKFLIVEMDGLKSNRR